MQFEASLWNESHSKALHCEAGDKGVNVVFNGAVWPARCGRQKRRDCAKEVAHLARGRYVTLTAELWIGKESQGKQSKA